MTVIELPDPPSAGEQAAEACSDTTQPTGTPEQPQTAGTKQPAKQPAKKMVKQKQTKKNCKSQPRTTKACRCPDREHCPHPWAKADDGAGTVVKSTVKMYWAHKASTLSFAAQEILLDAGAFVCQDCSLRAGCYRGDKGGRQVSIPQQRLPWLNPDFPQLSKRFEKAMARRTSIERLHKLMKFDLGDDRLTKPGNNSFQARLDKTLFAMHILIGHDQ